MVANGTVQYDVVLPKLNEGRNKENKLNLNKGIYYAYSTSRKDQQSMLSV